jgi:hypothetical protein
VEAEAMAVALLLGGVYDAGRMALNAGSQVVIAARCGSGATPSEVSCL